jgi:type IV secretory pathway VirB10-like protein
MDLTWNRRDNLAPAVMVAFALHIAVFAAIVLFDHRPMYLPTGSAVPIEIVASGPPKSPAKAEIAPRSQQAAAETPQPQPPPAPAPPDARPARSIAARESAPQHSAKAAPAPGPSAQPARPFSLDALAATIAKASRAAAPRPLAAALHGPTRPQTAPQPSPDAAPGVAQSDMAGLQQLLERLWNPNCAVEGAGAVMIPVKFVVGPSGRVIGRVAAGGTGPGDPVVSAAARRAIDAVHEAEPFAEAYRNNSFTVNFDGRKACSER